MGEARHDAKMKHFPNATRRAWNKTGYVAVDERGIGISPILDTRADAERWSEEADRAADRKAKRGERPCLRCERPFISEGIHNRLCPICRHGDAGPVPVRPSIERNR